MILRTATTNADDDGENGIPARLTMPTRVTLTPFGERVNSAK